MEAVRKESTLFSLEELEFIYTTSYDEDEISAEESTHDPVLFFSNGLGKMIRITIYDLWGRKII